MEQAAEKPKAKRRRWLQFTLRSLLLLTLLLSLPLAWVGNELAGKRREQDLAEAITKAGGSIVWRDVERISIPWGSQGDPFGPRYSWTHSSHIAAVELAAHTPAEFRALLARVKQLQYLSELNVSDSPFYDADLQGVERLPKLIRLDLTGTNVSDEAISTLLQLPALTTVNLEYTDITDAGLEKLAGLRSLDELDVTGTRVTEQGIAKLIRERSDIRVMWEGLLSSHEEVRAVRGLQRMGWSVYFVDKHGPLGVSVPQRNEPITTSEFSCLNIIRKLYLTVPEGAPRDTYLKLPELSGLKVFQSNGGMDESTLGQLAKCPNLHALVLWDHSLTEADFAILQAFPQVDALSLDAVTLTTRGIENIATARKLEYLGLHHAHLTKGSLTALQNVPNLAELTLKSCQLAPGATAPLRRLKKLKVLNLDGSNLNDAGVVPLLSLPVLEELDVGNSQITDRGLARLAEIKSLKRLRLSWIGNVTDEGRKAFSKLRPDVKLDE